MTIFTIGEIARRANVGVETVRFYERQGLLQGIHRKPSGYRQFDEQTLLTLQFIRNAKDVGFTLKEIKWLLELRMDPKTAKSEMRLQVRQKMSEIDSEIAALERKKKSLQSLVGKCQGNDPSHSCPILTELQERPLT